MKQLLDIFVPGVPISKGSAKAFVVKGRAIVTQDNGKRQKPWSKAIRYTAASKIQGPMTTGPVSIELVFYMPRPKSHFGTGKNAGALKDWAIDLHHVSKPDIDKLERCVLDALTGVVWKDDSQCVSLQSVKYYGNSLKPQGVEIVAYDLTGEKP